MIFLVTSLELPETSAPGVYQPVSAPNAHFPVPNTSRQPFATACRGMPNRVRQ